MDLYNNAYGINLAGLSDPELIAEIAQAVRNGTLITSLLDPRASGFEEQVVSYLVSFASWLNGVFGPVGDFFTRAQRWVRPRDPLTLDLDGDGLETVPVSSTNPILFDHDGDGLKNATGWIKPDDGFLVMDRNGNGTIDNGTELFGDSTNLYGGGKAADGFAALAQEDTNNDGKISSADANFAYLRVWRDLNQNGISESGELATLASLNIASIDVAKKNNSQPLPGGNEIADLGTYTRTDGSTGTVGEVMKLADVNLAVDTFHRQFPDSVPLAAGVTALPNMQGSGLVRDLWEAMSQSADLKSLVAQFAGATTKAAQMAIMDQILGPWADTSGLTGEREARTTAGTAQRRQREHATRQTAHEIGVSGRGNAGRSISCASRPSGKRRLPVDAARSRVGSPNRCRRRDFFACARAQVERGSFVRSQQGTA